MTDPDVPIPLAKAIQDLRTELLAAVTEGRDKDLRFRLDPVELELSLGMTLKGGVNAAVKFWVLEVGAKGEAERVAMHKLKLKLTPIDKEGHALTVRDTVSQMPQ